MSRDNLAEWDNQRGPVDNQVVEADNQVVSGYKQAVDTPEQAVAEQGMAAAVSFMIFLFVVAYELLLFERSIKRFDKKLKETKLMLREADEFLREEESTGLCDGKAFRFSRESHKKKLAELERVRRKVRRLLARTSVLLKEIKAEQRRMELQLASSEMKRRIQEFDRQNEEQGEVTLD